MEKFLTVLGVILVAIIMLALPAATIFAFCFSWSLQTKFILTVLTILLFYILFQVDTEE